MNEIIINYFKAHDLPKPITINYIGQWAYGDCYAVTCGIFRLKKYCVYFKDGQIYDVVRRG